MMVTRNKTKNTCNSAPTTIYCVGRGKLKCKVLEIVKRENYNK